MDFIGTLDSTEISWKLISAFMEEKIGHQGSFDKGTDL
jgi:hypothetical protein